MTDVLDDDVRAVLSLAAPDPEPVLAEMADHARERGFPFVGPQVGGLLRLLARAVDASRAFEFGSGFGYSAAWVAPVLPADGEIVLTDYDEDNLEAARRYLSRLDCADVARFEAGDALATVDRYDGPFEFVLVDHDKTQYVDALQAVRPRLADEAVVVADNVLAGPTTPAKVRAALAGDAPADDYTAGVVAYLEAIRDDDAFETVLVPLGEGVAVSYRSA